MNNFPVHLAAMIPFEMHIQAMKDAIKEYELVPSEDNKSLVSSAAMLLSLHSVAEKEGVDEMCKEIDDIERAHNFFKINEN